MTDRVKREQRQQLADLWSCHPDELRGQRFGDLLQEAERSGATVYWGFWTDAELQEAL